MRLIRKEDQINPTDDFLFSRLQEILPAHRKEPNTEILIKSVTDRRKTPRSPMDEKELKSSHSINNKERKLWQ